MPYNSNKANLNPFNIWGKIIVKLRQIHSNILHTICGEIRNVELMDNALIIKIEDDFLYEIINRKDNYNQLCSILAEIDSGLSLNIVLQQKPVDHAKEDYDRLVKLFGDRLKVR